MKSDRRWRKATDSPITADKLLLHTDPWRYATFPKIPWFSKSCLLPVSETRQWNRVIGQSCRGQDWTDKKSQNDYRCEEQPDIEEARESGPLARNHSRTGCFTLALGEKPLFQKSRGCLPPSSTHYLKHDNESGNTRDGDGTWCNRSPSPGRHPFMHQTLSWVERSCWLVVFIQKRINRRSLESRHQMPAEWNN